VNKKWVSTDKIKFVLGDTKVLSLDYHYGGSVDAVGVNGLGEVGIIDFKTSNRISESYAYQVAAYDRAFYETYGVQPTWWTIARFSKDKPEFEVAKIKDISKAFSVFNNCLQIYKAQKENAYV